MAWWAILAGGVRAPARSWGDSQCAAVTAYSWKTLSTPSGCLDTALVCLHPHCCSGCSSPFSLVHPLSPLLFTFTGKKLLVQELFTTHAGYMIWIVADNVPQEPEIFPWHRKLCCGQYWSTTGLWDSLFLESTTKPHLRLVLGLITLVPSPSLPGPALQAHLLETWLMDGLSTHKQSSSGCSCWRPPPWRHTNSPCLRLSHSNFSRSGREERAVGPSSAALADPLPSPPCHHCNRLSPPHPPCTHQISLPNPSSYKKRVLGFFNHW